MLVAIVRRLPIAIAAGLGLFLVSHAPARAATTMACSKAPIPINLSSFSFGVEKPTTSNVRQIVVTRQLDGLPQDPDPKSAIPSCTFTFAKGSGVIFNGELVSAVTIYDVHWLATVAPGTKGSSTETIKCAFSKITYAAASTMVPPMVNPKPTPTIKPKT